MEREELVNWMEKHEIAELLRLYVVNTVKRKQYYEPFKDLMKNGEAIVRISVREREPHMHILKMYAVTQNETIVPVESEVAHEPVAAAIVATAKPKPKRVKVKKSS